MAKFLAFRGIRPAEGMAELVSCLPYDVMNREEARRMAMGNEKSFLHVTRAEIDLPDDVNPYAPEVYRRGRENLERMQNDGVLRQDETPCYYIYRQVMRGRVQTGIVGAASIDDYLADIIKKHELTRIEKEEDRIRHFDCCSAHTEPVFLAYRGNTQLKALMGAWTASHAPAVDFISEDGIAHMLWVVTDRDVVEQIKTLFGEMPCLYIADGHHRSASSVKIGLARRASAQSYTGNEDFNYFLAVAFADDDLFIYDYNRVVRDLGGMSADEFLRRVEKDFEVAPQDGIYTPEGPHFFGMLLDGSWYRLHARRGSYNAQDVIARLDVSILQDNLLGPILGIADPRTDHRIDFVGGIRGLSELQRRTAKDMRVAFAMYPTTMEDLLSVADAGQIMPPKSTWFEPKLRSGLFIHAF